MARSKTRNRKVMTLKEKLRQNLTGHLSNDKTEVDVNIAAKIADDYAVEFAEWCLVNNVYKSETFDLDNLFLCGLQKYDDGTDKIYYLDELLEIFKKEKGL